MRMHQHGTLPDATRGELRRWAEARGCRLLVLFGSSAAANQRAGAESDVDLAVSLPALPPAEERLKLLGQLQDRVGERRADVVFLTPDTDPVLRFEIFRRGVALYESMPGIFVHEVVRALALYQDAIPFRRALRQSLTRHGAPS